MNMRITRWFPVALALSCNAKLSVAPPEQAGSGGSAGAEHAGASPDGESGASSEESGGRAQGAAGADVSAGLGGTSGNGFVPYAGTGGIGAPPPPGSLNQPCIQGGTTMEAAGTVAAATIVTLDSCDNGLTCNSRSRCVAAPACPQSTGICVLREGRLGATGNGGPALGFGGSPGQAGSGGQGPYFPPATDEPPITGLAADDSHLYWVEYGTRDSLGNHLGDGVLMSYSFADRKTKTLGSKLSGAVALGLSSAHAYVFVDGAPLIGNITHPQLLRVPLAGADAQLVQDGPSDKLLIGVGDHAYWYSILQIYSVTAEDPPTPSAWAKVPPAYSLQADASHLYFASGELLQRVALSDGVIDAGWQLPQRPFALKDDALYGIEAAQGMLLTKANKSDPTWQRVRALGAAYWGLELRIVGDRFFLHEYTHDSAQKNAIVSGLLSSAEPPVRLVTDTRTQPGPLLWVGTPTTLYWSDGFKIYEQSLTP